MIISESSDMNKLSILSLFVCMAVVYCETAGVDDSLITKKVEFDIQIGDEKDRKIVLGVFGNTAPKTVTNFVALAAHEV